MERALVAQQVANKLFATENAIDLAIADAAALVGELVKARQELGVSAVFGDEAMSKATCALAALGEARTAVVAAHLGLGEAKLRAGIRTKMVGSEPKPPNTSQLTPELRQVG